jgi:hypothetical protein
MARIPASKNTYYHCSGAPRAMPLIAQFAERAKPAMLCFSDRQTLLRDLTACGAGRIIKAKASA